MMQSKTYLYHQDMLSHGFIAFLHNEWANQTFRNLSTDVRVVPICSWLLSLEHVFETCVWIYGALKNMYIYKRPYYVNRLCHMFDHNHIMAVCDLTRRARRKIKTDWPKNYVYRSVIFDGPITEVIGLRVVNDRDL